MTSDRVAGERGLRVTCSRCGEALQEDGAMLIGLPDMYGMRTVRNLCRACFVQVEVKVFGGGANRLAAAVREERAQPAPMTHEERAQYAQKRAIERMQEEGILAFWGEPEAARKARRAEHVAKKPGSTDPHVMFVRPGTVWDPEQGMWVKAEGEGE